MGIGMTIFAILAGLSALIGSLSSTKVLYMSIFSPNYLLLILGVIVLIICYFISKKEK